MFVNRPSSRIRIGLAGWSNPPAVRTQRSAGQSHLAYYAARFSCVEINSSFYRGHQAATYARWRDETPPSFRFSVKMPRSVTHESQLKRCAAGVQRFFDEIVELQPKLAAVLVQLPPSLEYSARTARAFFKAVPAMGGTRVACEPRHAGWFTAAAGETLESLGVSRVAADPARFPGADCPRGAKQFAYFRWHGTPRMYYSAYSQQQLDAFAKMVVNTAATDIWCVFDNTARHAAWEDALKFSKLI